MPDTEAHLSAAQLHALFDILTHHETYGELAGFKYPDTPANSGYPFVKPAKNGTETHVAKSITPVIQQLLTTIVIPLFGLNSLPNSFWSVKVQGLVENLAEANLSESYDKGSLGIRKTLCTVFSSVLELISRGHLGGLPRHIRINECLLSNVYDLDCAHSLGKAWDDVVQEMVYGHLIDELFEHIRTVSGNLEEHSPAAKGAVHYIIMHLATICHQVFVVSAQGPYILKLLETMHKMVPWAMLKQTLRIGNAATMLNAMVKLFLSKLSFGSLSNWLGMTTDADDGMTLLQRVVSTILSWDSSDFKKTLGQIKKSKDGPTKEQMAAIDEHIKLTREEQNRLRATSIAEGQSIVVTILKSRQQSCPASDDEHSALLEYYSACLSIRDRDEISRVLCHSKPDFPTQILRDLINAFEPIIRELHSKIPLLNEASGDIEILLSELIGTAKGSGSRPAAITDFVGLLMRNRSRLYKWLHLLVKECPNAREDIRTWANDSIREFQRKSISRRSSVDRGEENDSQAHLRANGNSEHIRGDSAYCRGAAGDMSITLSQMFAALAPGTRTQVRQQLDNHAIYLETISDRSVVHMQDILDYIKSKGLSSSFGTMGISGENRCSNPTNNFSQSTIPVPVKEGVLVCDSAETMAAPGVYLVRWHDLLDETVVTSATPFGPTRRGKDVKLRPALGKGAIDGKVKEKEVPKELDQDVKGPRLAADMAEIGAPDVGAVVNSMGKQFRQLLADRRVDSQGVLRQCLLQPQHRTP